VTWWLHSTGYVNAPAFKGMIKLLTGVVIVPWSLCERLHASTKHLWGDAWNPQIWRLTLGYSVALMVPLYYP